MTFSRVSFRPSAHSAQYLAAAMCVKFTSLADAGRSVQPDQPVPIQEELHLPQLALPANETAQRSRHVAHC
jgi:hypothetical protein